MITHRLSTLVNADKIVMMHNGRIDSIRYTSGVDGFIWTLLCHVSAATRVLNV